MSGAVIKLAVCRSKDIPSCNGDIAFGIAERFGKAESERINSIKNNSARLLSLGGLIALDAVVDKGTCVIKRSEAGKPYFVDDSIGCFSISHSGELSVAACFCDEVGIDIEPVSREKEFARIAKRFFTTRELRRFEEGGADAESFLRIWTEKEAYVKYSGKTFAELYSKDTDGVVFKSVWLLCGGERYIVTICTAKDADIKTVLLNDSVRIIKGE